MVVGGVRELQQMVGIESEEFIQHEVYQSVAQGLHLVLQDTGGHSNPVLNHKIYIHNIINVKSTLAQFIIIATTSKPRMHVDRCTDMRRDAHACGWRHMDVDGYAGMTYGIVNIVFQTSPLENDL